MPQRDIKAKILRSSNTSLPKIRPRSTSSFGSSARRSRSARALTCHWPSRQRSTTQTSATAVATSSWKRSERTHFARVSLASPATTCMHAIDTNILFSAPDRSQAMYLRRPLRGAVGYLGPNGEGEQQLREGNPLRE